MVGGTSYRTPHFCPGRPRIFVREFIDAGQRCRTIHRSGLLSRLGREPARPRFGALRGLGGDVQGGGRAREHRAPAVSSDDDLAHRSQRVEVPAHGAGRLPAPLRDLLGRVGRPAGPAESLIHVQCRHQIRRCAFPRRHGAHAPHRDLIPACVTAADDQEPVRRRCVDLVARGRHGTDCDQLAHRGADPIRTCSPSTTQRFHHGCLLERDHLASSPRDHDRVDGDGRRRDRRGLQAADAHAGIADSPRNPDDMLTYWSRVRAGQRGLAGPAEGAGCSLRRRVRVHWWCLAG